MTSVHQYYQPQQSQDMLGKEMCQSSTIAYDSGLDRGMPWGRDLFTFVTSAAGYMMRTLQKPRKNKPSKRQVNHRRFLHNMIQRKFAEIEAANQQLASTLVTVDKVSPGQACVKSTDKSEQEQNLKPVTGSPGETERLTDQHEDDIKTLNKLVNNNKRKSLKNWTRVEDGQARKVGKEMEPNDLLLQISDFNYEKEITQPISVDLDSLAQLTNIIFGDKDLSSLECVERIKQNLNSNVIKITNEEKDQGQTFFDVFPTSPASALSLSLSDFEVEPDSGDTFQMLHFPELPQKDKKDKNFQLLDSLDRYIQTSCNKEKQALWHLQQEDDQSCFSNSFTSLDTSHDAFDMDNDWGDGNLNTLLENSVKSLNVENVSNICHQNEDVTQPIATIMDCCYVNQPEVNTIKNQECQSLLDSTWTISETMLKIFEQSKLSSPKFESNIYGNLDQTLVNYWIQNDIGKDDTLSTVKDSYHLLTADGKSSTETRCTQNPNSDYHDIFLSSPSSTAHCSGLNILPQCHNSCTVDVSLHSNGGTNPNIASFEGVAQSFSAPAYNLYSHPVLTPPLNDDWLFSNITTKDDCEDVVRTHSFTCRKRNSVKSN